MKHYLEAWEKVVSDLKLGGNIFTNHIGPVTSLYVAEKVLDTRIPIFLLELAYKFEEAIWVSNLQLKQGHNYTGILLTRHFI